MNSLRQSIPMFAFAVMCAIQLAGCATTGPSAEELRWLKESSQEPVRPSESEVSEDSSSASVSGTDDVVNGVRPGNLISLKSLEDSALNGRFRVLFDGRLILPYSQQIDTSGKTIGELQRRIREVYSPYFQDKSADLTVLLYSSEVMVEVRGLVQKPGRYFVKSDASLDELIAKAGGHATGKNPSFVAISDRSSSHTSGPSRVINLNTYYRTGEEAGMGRWQGGEVIALLEDVGPELSSQVSPVVRILGEVRHPGEYTFSSNADIYHYVALAGGPTTLADSDRVELVRGPSHKRRSITLTMKDFSDHVLLQNGDVIVVHANQPSTFERRLQIGAGLASVLTTLIVLLVAVF